MKTLIVFKHSKYEWERLTTNISHDDLVKKYIHECANLEAIMCGHEKQVHAREIFKTVFYDADFCFMDQFCPSMDRCYDAILVLGGDNSFTKISHYVSNANILGVNSDPERSSGHLLRWAINDPGDVYELREILDFNEFGIEEWTRLEATLDGTLIIPATSEYFLGEKLRDKMSRHVLEYRGKRYEQKCSGIIVSTGAGSTGWFGHVAVHKVEPYAVNWRPSEQRACFVVTEPFEPRSDDIILGALDKNEEIIIHSLNDDDGCISVDAWNHFAFQRGSHASVHIGSPLHVIVPKEK